MVRLGMPEAPEDKTICFIPIPCLFQRQAPPRSMGDLPTKRLVMMAVLDPLTLRWTNSATGLSRKTTALSKRRTRRGGGIVRRDSSGRHSSSTSTPSSEEEGDYEHDGGGGVTLVSRSTVRKEFTPVFGTGVVFYTSGAEVKGAMLWGFPGEATAAAAGAGAGAGAASPSGGGAAQESAADAAAGISARALDLLRTIMERSANMEADLTDERVMQAWVQGLSDAARVVAQETGVGHLQPMRR